MVKLVGEGVGLRGRLAANKNGDLFLVLPGNDADGTLKILKATKRGQYRDYELVWQNPGFPWEPLVDPARLEADSVLSVFAVRNSAEGRQVVVLDFEV